MNNSRPQKSGPFLLDEIYEYDERLYYCGAGRNALLIKDPLTFLLGEMNSTSKSKNIIQIVGDSGVGKTTFIKQLMLKKDCDYYFCSLEALRDQSFEFLYLDIVTKQKTKNTVFIVDDNSFSSGDYNIVKKFSDSFYNSISVKFKTFFIISSRNSFDVSDERRNLVTLFFNLFPAEKVMKMAPIFFPNSKQILSQEEKTLSEFLTLKLIE